MPGVGTLIDMSGIIAGGATALAFGRLFSEQMKNMMMTVCGISVFVIGITGIMQGMLTVSGGAVSVNGSIPLLISLVAGTVIGELLGIEKRIANLGGLMQKQFARGEGGNFADGRRRRHGCDGTDHRRPLRRPLHAHRKSAVRFCDHHGTDRAVRQRLPLRFSAGRRLAGESDFARLPGEVFSHRRGAGIFDYDRIHYDPVPWDQSDLEQGDPSREYAADGRDRCGIIVYTWVIIRTVQNRRE